jgi:uncharacterized protein (DUF4415 family)
MPNKRGNPRKVSQKASSVKFDLDLLDDLKKVGNKNRLINILLRNYFKNNSQNV